MDRKGKGPKAKAQGKHLRNSCGSESRKGERKRTESRVRRTGKESMRNQAGENGENQRSESGREAPKKTHCEGETGRKRKGRNRGQVARTGREADERKRIGRGKPESIREAPEEQLRERIREG